MIEILVYNPKWPEMFAEEASRIRKALGTLADRIEHVGSTAVPGLASKPVIDIQISVLSLSSRSVFDEMLKELGYTHFSLGDFDLVYPFFKRPITWPSTHHVHLCAKGSIQEQNHLAFRDHLRGNPVSAARYAELKKQLASLHHGDTLESQERYSLAKSAFISGVLSETHVKDLPC